MSFKDDYFFIDSLSAEHHPFYRIARKSVSWAECRFWWQGRLREAEKKKTHTGCSVSAWLFKGSYRKTERQKEREACSGLRRSKFIRCEWASFLPMCVNGQMTTEDGPWPPIEPEMSTQREVGSTVVQQETFIPESRWKCTAGIPTVFCWGRSWLEGLVLGPWRAVLKSCSRCEVLTWTAMTIRPLPFCIPEETWKIIISGLKSRWFGYRINQRFFFGGGSFKNMEE